MTRVDLPPREALELSLRARFLETDSGCWEWSKTRNDQGYGRLWLPGIGHRAAHRISAHLWIEGFHYNDFPLMVCHRCDNPPCVNPAHLFIGTARDNMRDAARKGRLPGTPGPRDNLLVHPRIRACQACGNDYAPDGDHRGRSRVCSWSCASDLRGKQRRGRGFTITPDMAAEILRRLASGETGKSIAADLGVSRASVSHIKNGIRVITR